MYLKERHRDGVIIFNLKNYNYMWITPNQLAIRMRKGWELFEVLGLDDSENIMLNVKYLGKLSTLPVEVLG
ncbi:MAG: hypothetical protein N2505_05395 [Endomicrobia bacterium]|nr:hypothetical protein [Endomicrobiia bacterium]